MPVAIKYTNHFNTGGAQIGAGLRAFEDGPVGYLGSLGDLTVLTPSDPAPAGCSWDGVALIVSTGVTLDHYDIQGACVVVTGTSATVTNCRINAPSGTIFVLTCTNSSGTLTATDNTVIGNSSGTTYHVNGISSDGRLIARRNDVRGSGDGIHANASTLGTSLISQNYVHDLASVDVDQHLDGFQIFNFQAATVTVEHNYVLMPDSGVAGVSSAMTCGTENLADPIITMVIDNNYFNHGAFTLRLNLRLQNCAVTNNDFGQLLVGEFGDVAVDEPACLLSGAAGWDENRDYLGNLISRPT